MLTHFRSVGTNIFQPKSPPIRILFWMQSGIR